MRHFVGASLFAPPASRSFSAPLRFLGGRWAVVGSIFRLLRLIHRQYLRVIGFIVGLARLSRRPGPPWIKSTKWLGCDHLRFRRFCRPPIHRCRLKILDKSITILNIAVLALSLIIICFLNGCVHDSTTSSGRSRRVSPRGEPVLVSCRSISCHCHIHVRRSLKFYFKKSC